MGGAVFEKAGDGQLVISYLTLRRAVGLLGVLFPVVLAVGGLVAGPDPGLQPSISDYYGTPMRDVFVGVLFAIGWFLFSYRGYERKDDVAGNLAWLFAMIVALFPVTSGRPVIRSIHFVSAAALFLVLSYFSLFLFTKSGGDPTPRKAIRNAVYILCGLVMVGAVALVGVYHALLEHTVIDSLEPVFWLETLALWAFGASWFVKGETLWKDREAD
jgi:hypothetical protein